MDFVVAALFVLPIIWLIAVAVVKALEHGLQRKLVSTGTIALVIFVGAVVAGVVAAIGLAFVLGGDPS